MAKTDFKNIDEYHATFSGEALAKCEIEELPEGLFREWTAEYQP